jgi:peptide/nickel transport system permease protein
MVAARLAQMIAVIVMTTALAFGLLNLLHGNVVDAILGENYSPEAAATLTRDLHLDQPIVTRYLIWLGDALRGDLGTSLISHQGVAESIFTALGPTVELMVFGQLVALVLTFITTALAVRFRPVGSVVTAIGLFFNAVPTFVSGLVLIIVFATTMRVLPSVGWAPIGEEGLAANLKALILPSIAVGLAVFPEYMRVLRADITEQLEREEYVTLARMKGLSQGRVMGSHVLRNSAGGLITLIAVSTGHLLSGVVIAEQVFSIPGLGSLTLRAITDRDAPMAQGIIVVVAIAVVVFNLVGELIHMRLDPRVRPQRSQRWRRREQVPGQPGAPVPDPVLVETVRR